MGDVQLRVLAQGSVPLAALEAHPLLAQHLVPRLREAGGGVRPDGNVPLFPSLVDIEVCGLGWGGVNCCHQRHVALVWEAYMYCPHECTAANR